MTKTNINLADTAEEAIKQFEEEHQKNLNIFKTNLNELRTNERLELKQNFLTLVQKHLNIFYYAASDREQKKKDNVTFYMNFGKEHEKVQNILKCSGDLVFKEDAGGKFSNQIYVNNIESISPFFKYLLEFLHDQFSLIDYDNITLPTSKLTIFNKKIKNILREKHICLNNDDEVIVMVKGLGTSDFINIPTKQINIKIVFDTAYFTYVYTASKNQIRKLFTKESEDGKKGQECKELLKWIEMNKLNDKRTKYCVVPSQISISKSDFEEYKLSKRFKSDYESISDIQKKLKNYFSNLNSKIITVNMKFWITVTMNITSFGDEVKSEFDMFNDEVVVEESQEQKEIKIVNLHKTFRQTFKRLIAEGNLEEVVTKKTNIEIKDNIFNPYENIETEDVQIEEPPLIKKLSNSDDEVSDIESI